MNTQDRRDRIVAILDNPDNALTVPELRDVLRARAAVRAPESTIRLDLRRLTEAGRVRKAGVASTGAQCWTAVTP